MEEQYDKETKEGGSKEYYHQPGWRIRLNKFSVVNSTDQKNEACCKQIPAYFQNDETIKNQRDD